MSWRHLVAATLGASLFAGCGGSTITPPVDAGPTYDAGAGCFLSDRSFCAAGSSCPSPDGCNVCSCGVGGVAACTERACVLDGGSAPDTGPAGCTLPGGGFCAVGATCPLPDDCNSCTCDASGRALCTARPCAADAGPPPDEMCVIDCAAPPPGCHYEGVTSCDPPSCGRLVCADAGGPVMCGEAFPAFDRRCAAAADCFVAVHQTNCCGDSRAMGLNVAAREQFVSAEGICAPMFPACGCPAHAPVLDDGSFATFDGTVAVDCRAGVCTTHAG